MLIKEIFQQKHPVLSLEIFPPRPEYPLETVYETLNHLKSLRPDFISVTYGAGGSSRGRTLEIAKYIRDNCTTESMAHLTCIGHTPTEISSLLKSFKVNGIENVLALRGDLPQTNPLSQTGLESFSYAQDLVRYIQANGEFSIGAAAYPEGHPQSTDLKYDIEKLKEKVECGVDFLITQLFLDNRYFFDFVERVCKAGMKLPISAGIMPVLNTNIQRIIALSRATVPPRLQRLLETYGEDPVSMEKAGIEYAVNQIQELFAHGVDGIHLYTMNKPVQTQEIIRQINPTGFITR